MHGKRVRIPTGISIKPAEWSFEKQIILGRSKSIADNNLVLRNCMARVNDILVKYRLQYKDLTAEMLKYEYAHYSASIDFGAFMEEEISLRESELENSTIRQHKVCLNKLRQFSKELIFSQMDEQFIHRFKVYLKEVLKNDTYTISSNLKVLKVYINRAIKKKIISDNPFKNIGLVQPKNDRIFLTENEIKLLINMYRRKWLPASHQKCLRHFLFSINTGLRISDVKAISMDNIVKETLVFTPYKTRNQKAAVVRIPLTNLAKEMIRDESAHRLRGPVFTMLSEFRTNKYLREIAAELKISKHISFHVARHTFATFFLKKTKNLLALQKLLGHSDMRETMIYSHILMEDIEREMLCFDELM